MFSIILFSSNSLFTSDPRLDSDISIPYGYMEQKKKHPDGGSLGNFITNFGIKNNFWKGLEANTHIFFITFSSLTIDIRIRGSKCHFVKSMVFKIFLKPSN